MTTNIIKEAALRYAKQGFLVFPLVPNEKRPLTAQGFKEASSDVRQIKEWWGKCPNANIGIPTGTMNKNIVVIDLDVHNENGIETLQQWESENQTLPKTLTATTGSGGKHLYYISKDIDYGNRVGLLPGIDIRANGGYVVAPPSVISAGAYTWNTSNGHIAECNATVKSLLNDKNVVNQRPLELGNDIPLGERNHTLYKLACSLRDKNIGESGIFSTLSAENKEKCTPPLDDKELHKIVESALKYEPKHSYNATTENGIIKAVKPIKALNLSKMEKKEVEWLINDYIPKGQIITLASDGGVGKTTLWCALASAISNGKKSFLNDELMPFEFWDNPRKVLFLSGEDLPEYTLLGRLEKLGANLENIITTDIEDISKLDFKSAQLDQLIKENKPALCIYDPIQAFIPDNVKMGERNAMRSCLTPLIAHGKKYGCTSILVAHTNKRQGAYGRNRIAESSDIWDISRSVLIAGNTEADGIKYLSHEKSNYGPLSETILFNIDNGIPVFNSYTDKKDRDYMMERPSVKPSQSKDEAKQIIIDRLEEEGGTMKSKDLNDFAKAMSISSGTLQRAKKDLKDQKKIFTYKGGAEKENQWYVSLRVL